MGVACSGDEQGDAAAGSGVVVMVLRVCGGGRRRGRRWPRAMRVAPTSRSPMASMCCGEADVKEDDGGSEDGDGEGVAEGVEEAETHAFSPGALDAGDVGDGGEVVVVEAVAEAEEGAGEEGEFEARRHVVW